MTERVVVEGISKRFKRYHTRARTTLKETVVGWWRRRDGPPPRLVEALKEVSFQVADGTILGIIGRNGSGKSTLLKVVAGVYAPTTGRVEVRGRVSTLLSLGLGFHPDLTGRENVRINGLVLGLTPKEIRERFDRIVEFAEMGEFIDAPVRTYSSGMFVRLAFSIATHVDPDVLLLDEVTSVGDAEFGKRCTARMDEFKAQGKTILLVTHNLALVASWCHQGLWLDHGEMRFLGPAAEAVARYEGSFQAAPAS